MGQGDIDRGSSIAEMVQSMFPTDQPSGVKISMPLIVVEDLVADTTTRGVQNPFDVDCMVIAMVNVTTLDAGETVDVGVAANATTSADNLIDAGDVGAAVTVLASFDDNDSGTNGQAAKLIDKKDGTNDYVTFTFTAGTDAVAGQLILVFFPIG